MPQSFVNQAIARCSVKGSKYWFNCNPEGPNHWFKIEWIDKAKEKLFVTKKPKKQLITNQTVDILKDSIIRSFFYQTYGKQRLHEFLKCEK